VKNIFKGFKIYFDGLKFWLRSPALLRLSIIPLLIDFVIFAGALVFAMSELPKIMGQIVSQPDFWYQYLWYYFLWLLTALSLFLIVMFFAFVVANLLAFPFNDLLAEKTLLLHEALPERSSGVKSWAKKTAKNAASMAKKTVFLIIIAGILALATLLPGLGIIASFIGVFMMAVDRVDYSFDHHVMTFKQRLSFVKSNYTLILGFALGMGLTTILAFFRCSIRR